MSNVATPRLIKAEREALKENTAFALQGLRNLRKEVGLRALEAAMRRLRAEEKLAHKLAEARLVVERLEKELEK